MHEDFIHLCTDNMYVLIYIIYLTRPLRINLVYTYYSAGQKFVFLEKLKKYINRKFKVRFSFFTHKYSSIH